MKNSKYIKVSVSDRIPETAGYYFIINRATGKQTLYFNGRSFAESFIDFEYWLEEKPDYEDEMKEMLEECRLQLEHLNRKQRGTTNSVLSRLETLLTKLK